MKNVGVDGLTINHSSGSPISNGTFTITSTPSAKIAIESNGVFSGALAFSFSGGNMSGMVNGSVTGKGTIAPGSIKVRHNRQFFIVLGDKGTLSGTAQPTGSPPPPPVQVTGPVEISDAHQTTWRAR